MTHIQDFIESLRLGDFRHYGALTMVPLVSPLSPGAEYLVLDEALATGRFQIGEVSDGGLVPVLRATNFTDRPVFLLEGEELIGAKQNRVLNLSVLIPAGAAVIIPVSCVEAGRWRRHSSDFSASSNTQFAGGRARKIAQVSRSLAEDVTPRSDQSDVWAMIADRAVQLGVESDTRAMADIFRHHSRSIDEYCRALVPVQDQVGGIFIIGGVIVGLDAFDNATSYAKLHRKLVAGYAADALCIRSPGGAMPRDEVNNFLKCTKSSEATSFDVVGSGRSVRLESNKLTGAALVADGRVLHLSIFVKNAIDRDPRGAWL
jgi:hypothetical protein